MAAIQRGDFALADRVLRPLQWPSLPGGPQQSAVWSNPANFEKYGPTGDASTNEPVGVASRRLPCRPSNGPGQSNIDNSNFVQGSGVASGRLSDPLAKYDYKLTSNYGPRISPTTGRQSFHHGIDLAHYEGTPFVAADGGVVVESKWNGLYGNWILIDHGNGLATWYGHNKVNYVKAGDTVDPGQPIGEVGSTGGSTGPHIDLGVIEGYVTGDRNSGVEVDPRKHFNLPPVGTFNTPQ
ncbi:M23 family metallopeptidase (plasmid) [Acaryochloris marina S15]|nr:M23 family metallopeptidase [Acaryochloris marina S15]